MNKINSEWPEIEYSDKGREDRRIVKNLLAMKERLDKQDAEYRKAGFIVLYQVVEREGNSEKDIYMLKGPDGSYSFQVNGKTTIQERTRADCAKRAFIAGHIGYFTYVEICHGKAAAERAKKNPRILETLKKYGAAMY